MYLAVVSGWSADDVWVWAWVIFFHKLGYLGKCTTSIEKNCLLYSHRTQCSINSNYIKLGQCFQIIFIFTDFLCSFNCVWFFVLLIIESAKIPSCEFISPFNCFKWFFVYFKDLLFSTHINDCMSFCVLLQPPQPSWAISSTISFSTHFLLTYHYSIYLMNSI